MLLANSTETAPESGAYAYMVGLIEPDTTINMRIFQYGFSTAWDVSTCAYTNKLFDTETQAQYPYWVAVSPDGETMFIGAVMYENSPETCVIWQYTLTVPGDVSSATYSGKSYETAYNFLTAGTVTPDGLHLYFISSNESGLPLLREYSLSTAWDVTTASYVRTLDLTLYEYAGFSVVFKPDGTEMYLTSTAADEFSDAPILQFTLSTPFNIGTATYAGEYVVAAPNNLPGGLAISGDGLTLILVVNPDWILPAWLMLQYTFGTAWDITTLAPSGSPQKQFNMEASPEVHQGIFSLSIP